MNAIEFMRILQSKGVDVSYTVMDGAYDGLVYSKALDKDIPCRPSLACTISNKDEYFKFVAIDDCYLNKYDSIFTQLLDDDYEDYFDVLVHIADVNYDTLYDWTYSYVAGEVI